MVLLCKQKALYVKGCVIPNGIQDSQGDTLYSEDIKKIFTSFNNQDNFEILHNDLALPEVSLLENYISTANESIGNMIVPAGSWNVVIRVDNPEVQAGLLNGELGGLSLSNRVAPRCKGNLKGIIRYKDIADAECIVPKWISLVERGANGYGLHVYDYDAYILKSKDVEFEEENGGKRMDFKEFWKSLKSLIEEVEAPEEEAPAIEKEDEETEEEVEVEATATEEETEEAADETETEEEPAVEKEDTTAEEEESEEEAPAIEKEDNEEETDETAESEDEETDEAEITKEDEEVAGETDLEARVAKLEEIVAALTTEEEVEEESETPDPEIEPEDEDTPKITKSEKVVITDKTIPETLNYYQMSGRDPLTGKKIRN